MESMESTTFKIERGRENNPIKLSRIGKDWPISSFTLNQVA